MDLTERTTDDRTRRSVLATVAAGAIGAIAGCLGGDRDGPDPVAVPGNQECDSCGMRIEMHPGPVGQAFYTDDPPAALPDDREDGVSWFCSSTCTYGYLLENEERGHEPTVAYGTDYSTVEYELDEEGGVTVISAHLEPEAFTDLRELTFVANSGVEGAMGGSLIGFGADGAETFADDHGGELLAHGDVTRELLAGLEG